MTRTFVTAFVCLSLAGSAFAQGPATKRLITETDINKFVWSADPQTSADGKWVAFTRVSINKDDYETSIWLASTDGKTAPRQFTAGPRDNAPRFSPDGSLLAFVRVAEKDGRRQPPQLYLIPMAGGEPRSITDLARGAGAATFSNDGKTIIFTSTTTDDDIAKAKNPPKDPPKESDVRVITRAVYRSNGGGFNDTTRRAQIYAVTLSDGVAAAPKRLSNDNFGAGAPQFSKDGSTIYYRSLHVKEPYFEDSRSQIWSIPASGGDSKLAFDFEGSMGDFEFSPDGRRLAFTGNQNMKPTRSFDQSELFLADVANGAIGAPRNLTSAYDYEIGGGVGGDQNPPRGGNAGGLIWTPDGKSLIIKVGEQGRANLKRIDASTGAVSAVASPTPSSQVMVSRRPDDSSGKTAGTWAPGSPASIAA